MGWGRGILCAGMGSQLKFWDPKMGVVEKGFNNEWYKFTFFGSKMDQMIDAKGL